MDKLNPQPSILPEGTVFTCPECDIELAKLLHDIFPGDVLGGAIEAIAWDPAIDKKMICPNCGAHFAARFENRIAVHTKGGWV